MHAVWSAMLDGKTLVVDEEALDVVVPGDDAVLEGDHGGVQRGAPPARDGEEGVVQGEAGGAAARYGCGDRA
jgi:hypothetical protein